jgi:CMP-N-acetylneuraminic acid synthetase
LGEVHEHPSIMKKIVGKAIEPYVKEMLMTTRRQDNEVAYFPYGVAYIVKMKTLLEEKTFYPKRTTHHLIKRYQCYEIDDIYDFLAIENIMKYERDLK